MGIKSSQGSKAICDCDLPLFGCQLGNSGRKVRNVLEKTTNSVSVTEKCRQTSNHH
jgi:hypothetical protein